MSLTEAQADAILAILAEEYDRNPGAFESLLATAAAFSQPEAESTAA